MKLLNRYLLLELVFPFGLALSLISFLLLMNRLLTLVDLVLKHGVPVWVVLKLVAYLLPSTFAITVPMSLLVAVLVALGRLASDLELVAMRAGGIGLQRLWWPLAALGLVLSLGMMAFNEAALPAANSSYKSLFYDVLSKRTAVAIQEKVYVKEFEGLVLYVERKWPDGRLEGITLLKPGQPGEALQWIHAKTGRVIADQAGFKVFLELDDGTVQFLGEDSSAFNLFAYRRSRVDLDIGGALRQLQSADKQPQEMSVREIRGHLKAMPAGDQRRPHWGTEMHKKISIPFACLAFMLAGFPLGTLTRKGGRMLGFTFALGLIFSYYVMLSLGQTYGDSGRLPPWLAMWLPNLVLAGLSGLLAWSAFKERGLFRFARG